MQETSSFRTNQLLKWLGVIGLIILCVISCYSGAVELVLYSYMPEESYYDTDQCRATAQSEAYQVAYDVMDQDFDSIALYRSVNSRFRVEELDLSTKTFHEIYNDSDSSEKYGKEFRFIAFATHDERDVRLYSDYSNLPWQSGTTYRITTYVKDPIEPDSNNYYRDYAFFMVTAPYRKIAGPVLVASLLGATVLLIYEFTAAGYKKGYKGIYLTWFDHIPFDIVSVVFLGFLIPAFGTLVAMMSSYFLDGSFLFSTLIPISASVTGLCLIIYAYLLTFAVRIKSGTLFSNMVISRIFMVIYHFFYSFYTDWKKSSQAWKYVCLFMCGFLVLESFLLYRRYADGIALFFFLITALILFVFFRIGRNTQPLIYAAKQLSEGNLDYRISKEEQDKMFGPFYEHAQNLNEIGKGMQKAVTEQLKSEKMKAELITNVSHDIRTPLTSVINYVDLLKKPHTPEQAEQYLDVLERQSNRLKRLTEDVVEASKASTGNIQKHMEIVNVKELIEQALGEYQDRFDQANLKPVINVDEGLKVYADGRLLWRVLRNLLSNVSKYAMPYSRVYMDSFAEKDNHVYILVKNTSKDELNISADELMERFVRGDSSRHTEGSGLGLSIARSLTELMGGRFSLTVDGDLFKAEIILNANPDGRMEK